MFERSWNQAKRALKSYSAFYNANAGLKSFLANHKRRRLAARYGRAGRDIEGRQTVAEVRAVVQKRLADRGVHRIPTGNRLRIFWVGANEAQDNSGFLQGLSQFGEVICFRQPSGEYGQEFSTKLYDPDVIQRNSEGLLRQIAVAQTEDGHIDILFGQMWANYISVDVLKQIQALGIITVNVAMDDRLPELWGTYRGVRLGSVGLSDGLDLVLTSAPECCMWYGVHGCPALFWPMASDPNLFMPADEKDIAVSFVGNKYGNRGRLISRLMREGIKVEPFGSGWPNGPVGATELARIFGRSRIILGTATVGYNKDVYTLKLRDFDATMAGALYLTHRNPDLLELYKEGEEIECYRDEQEAVDKIKYYLAHPLECDRIGRAGAKRARRDHTWQHRLGQAFCTIGITNEITPETEPRQQMLP